MKPNVLLLSCEHAVDTVPLAYQSLFIPFKELLASHRGIDFGALAIASYLKDFFQCPLIQAHATRLLVDCNRSMKNERCFSEITRDLDSHSKQVILQQYYLPFREQVIQQISAYIESGVQVWHISIHSFTPILNGQVRTAEIGLLYDPGRQGEKILARSWQQQIKRAQPAYRVRLNYPYLGISDGFTRSLRSLFSANDYLGIELEANQALTLDAQSLNRLKKILAQSLLNIRAANLMLS